MGIGLELFLVHQKETRWCVEHGGGADLSASRGQRNLTKLVES